MRVRASSDPWRPVPKKESQRVVASGFYILRLRHLRQAFFTRERGTRSSLTSDPRNHGTRPPYALSADRTSPLEPRAHLLCCLVCWLIIGTGRALARSGEPRRQLGGGAGGMDGGDGAQKQQEELHHPHSTHRLDLHLPLSPVVLSATQPADPGNPQPAANAAAAASAGDGPAAAQPSKGAEATATAGDAGGSLLRSAQRSASLISRQSSQFLQPVRRSGIQVYTFGRGDCGQLGNGGTEDSATPVPVDALQGKDVVGLSGGYFHSAAVSGGRAWAAAGTDHEQSAGRQLHILHAAARHACRPTS